MATYQEFHEIKPVNTIHIFLSGSVRKGAGDNRPEAFFWSDADERVLAGALAGMDVEILNPGTIDIPKFEYLERFEADIEMLLRSDVVVVDARTKKGLGVGAEMAIAKRAGIPIFALCPIGSEYRGYVGTDGEEREWIHAFVAGLSDSVFESIGDVAERIRSDIAEGRLELRDGVPCFSPEDVI
jgi:hypothetical protein